MKGCQTYLAPRIKLLRAPLAPRAESFAQTHYLDKAEGDQPK